MWIRSQDKCLLGDYKFIGVCNKEIRVETNLDIDILGKYENHQRALEVLDEIQRSLCNELPSDPNSYIGVYQMPEK